MSLSDWLDVYMCVFVWWIVLRDAWKEYRKSVTRKYILAMKDNESEVKFLSSILALSEFSGNKKPSVRMMKKYIKEHKAK